MFDPTQTFRRLAVFCGSNLGAQAAYRVAAVELGELLVRRGLGVVYGGGDVGLMGVLADAVMAAGGEVIGVIPRHLEEEELAHLGVTELRVVDSMHERKQLIYELADAMVAMPGGIGTLEELLEALTWNQLHLHAKPCGLLNVEGYFDPLVAMLDRAVEQQFLHRECRELLVVESGVERLLEALGKKRSPPGKKWLSRPHRRCGPSQPPFDD
ncbi:MAG: TIGR00730 family Rossman fold protein [bacterium]|nr:TIGR00730 family Rossman fold protein [bacterium]